MVILSRRGGGQRSVVRGVVARLRPVVVVAALGVAVALGAPGCSASTPEGVAALVQQGEQARHAVAAERDRLVELAPSAPAGTPARVELDAAIAAADARLALLDAGIARAKAALAEAQAPTDALTVTAQALAAALPEPIGPTLVLGTALVVSLARARQLKQGAASIARSIAKAAEADPEFSQAFARQAPVLRGIQTPTAARIVDEATGDRGLVRLPI